jgi:hypothetical protein
MITEGLSGRLVRRRLGLLAALYFSIAANVSAAPGWQSNLSKDPPGDFPPPRSLHANYVFGWSGFTAATAEVQFARLVPDRVQIQGTGRTVCLARAWWRYDVTYRAVGDSMTMRPGETHQTDTYRAKKITTDLTFTGNTVRRSRTETPPPAPGKNKPKDFAFPNLFDLQTAMLYVRSQPLQKGDAYRLVVYPSTNAYVATVTVTGREKISVRSGNYNAIKLDLQLKRVGKDMTLEPHRKFRRAAIWISDDSDRLVLRIEAQVFVGTVFAELQSIKFDEPRS